MTLRAGATPPALALRRAEEAMPSLGATVTIRELLRAEWRAAQAARDEHTFLADDGQRYVAAIGVDLFDAAVLAAGAIDPDTGAPLWDAATIIGWPRRDDLWADVRRVAGRILALSEVGADATKSGDPPPDA